MNDGERTRAIWPLLIAAGAVLLRLSIGAWPVDDAYITFRHSRNLLEGLGFVFNPGEAVLGTSAPLYGLLLALVGRVVAVELVQISFALNAVADGCIVVLLSVVGRRHGLPEWAVGVLALLWAFYPLAIRYSVGGMEAPLAGALLLAAYTACLDRRHILSGGLLALSALLRPELTLVAGLLGADLILRQRARPWAAFGLFALIGAGWILFATITYGSPLPQSIQAKTHDVYTTSAWQNTRQIRAQLTTLISNDPGFGAQGLQASDRIVPNTLEMAGLALVVVLCGVGVRAAYRTHPPAGALFAGAGVVMLGYAFASFRGNLIAEWYLVPLTPILCLALVGGLARLAEVIGPRWRLIMWTAAAFLVVVQIAGLNLGRDRSRPWWTPQVVWVERENLYREAATELKSRLVPGDVVAAPEIGALGYFCECLILDTVGLVSPQALKHYPLPPGSSEINNAVPFTLIRDERPRFIVTLDVFVRGTLLDTEWFQQHYHAVWERKTQVFHSQALIIFERISEEP